MNARNKGNSYERKLAKELREFFPDCATSRYASKETDDKKVDFVNTGGWNIQAKAVEKFAGFHKLLDEMPQEAGQINLVFHKRNRKGEVVAMRKEDFFHLLRNFLSK